jgi:hypothetical protein
LRLQVAIFGLDGLPTYNHRAQKTFPKREKVIHLFKTVPVVEPEVYATTKGIWVSHGEDYEE